MTHTHQKQIQSIAKVIDEYSTTHRLDNFILSTYMLLNETGGGANDVWFDTHDFILDVNGKPTSLMKKIWFDTDVGYAILQKTQSCFFVNQKKNMNSEDENNLLISKRVCVFFQKITGNEKISDEKTIFEYTYDLATSDPKYQGIAMICGHFSRLYFEKSLTASQMKLNIESSVKNYFSLIEQCIGDLSDVTTRQNIFDVCQDIKKLKTNEELFDNLVTLLKTSISTGYSLATNIREEIAYCAPIFYTLKQMFDNFDECAKDESSATYKVGIFNKLVEHFNIQQYYSAKDFVHQYDIKNKAISQSIQAINGSMSIYLDCVIATESFKKNFSENTAINEKNKIEQIVLGGKDKPAKKLKM
jgi:hypothetical protein